MKEQSKNEREHAEGAGLGERGTEKNKRSIWI